MEEYGNKSSWGPGPWQDEPDELTWQHGSGLRCRVTRSDSGALCGYVCVPEEHPFHGLGIMGLRVRYDIAAHGGITYAEPEPDGYWIGFDCGHAGDYLPGLAARLELCGFRSELLFQPKRYRAWDYVRAQVEGLAEQVHAARSVVN